MKKLRRWTGSCLLGMTALILTSCGQDMLPEEVYKSSIAKMEQLDSVYFTESSQLQVGEDQVSSFTRGVVTYQTPLKAYMETEMNVVDVSEPLDLHIRVNGDDVTIRENGETTWEEYNTSAESVLMKARPTHTLEFFLDFEEEFLMKEENDLYHVSFKGTDDRHIALAEKKLRRLGIAEEGVLTEETLNSIELDRIEMVAYIDTETMYMVGYDTRFTFTMELLGDLVRFNEIIYVRYDDHNHVTGDLEQFMEEKIKEIEREKMEEREDEEDEEEEIITE